MKYIPRAFLLCCLFGCGANKQEKSGSDIVIGKRETLSSAIMGEQRRIMIYSPAGEGRHDSSTRYPVVYLLDGEAHFYFVVGMIQQLSTVNGNTICPQMIVVGILNNDRMHDLTPTHAARGYNGDTSGLGTTGGGEKLTEFIEKELIPHIDSNYPTAPYRMFIGHSLGGLMVVNTLIHHPQLFNAYLAIDPSMWYDQQKLLHQADTVLANNHYAGKSLFLAVANTMSHGMDTARVRKDTSGGNLHIRCILQLADELRRNNGDGLRWTYKYYDGDNHGSVPLIAEYDALHFFFNYYPLNFMYGLMDSSISATAAVDSLRDHFKTVSANMGYTMLPPEDYVNEWGYNFLQSKMMDKSRAFFQLNIDDYPASGNVYDSMGDYYAAAGDKQKAIEMYTKAYGIDNSVDTKVKLDKLKK
jgi:predicted alpha/beta superfamily hydrolase